MGGKASAASVTDRYVVLVLDTSGSMSGTPFKVQKEAAKVFCEKIHATTGNNNVAIVALESYAEVKCQFTNDISVLNACIDGLYAGGGTNTNDALEVAGNLLDTVTNSNAVKNIVLCSDGLPERGVYTSDGQYTYDDYWGYDHANSAYNTAQRLKAKYNIYTLGFFHSLTEGDLEFGRRFMQDIASANSYYEVTDVEKLTFTFGEIAEEVVNPTSKNPIIIIPGIMGSRLFNSDNVFNGSTEIWVPSLLDIPLLGLKMLANMHVRPCENQNVDLSKNDGSGSSVFTYGREYGATNAYEELVEHLCNVYAVGTENYRPVYFFSYDWRQSNADSANKLNDAILKILRETGAGKVDLVCHSMGGLVASNYYVRYGADQLNSIITCGTPYEGSPTLINSVMNWDMLGQGANVTKKSTWEDLVLAFAGMTRKVKAALPGVTELLPTENYVRAIPMWKDSWIPFSQGDYQISFEEYQDICRKVFPSYDDSYTVQENLKDGDYNALLKYDKAYFVLGINQDTITAIKYQFTNNDVDQRMKEDDLKYSKKGDGTVPYYSASICEQLEKLGNDRVVSCDANHEEVVKKARCLDWIVDKLNNSASSFTGDPFNPTGFIVVRIACPVDVAISHGSETLSSSTENFVYRTSFGRLDILGQSDDIKISCITSSPDFSVVLRGTDDGTMNYSIRFFDKDENIYKEDIFEDVPITKQTVIYTGTDESETTILRIDHDGDGIIDDYLVPDSSEGVFKITRQPEDQYVNAGESAVFSVVTDTENLNYQWFVNYNDGKGWSSLYNATGSECVVQASLSDDGKQYHCLITNSEGKTISSNAAVLHVSSSGGEDRHSFYKSSGSGGGCNSLNMSMLLLTILLAIVKLPDENHKFQDNSEG